MTSTRHAVIVATARTPIGRAGKGSLRDERPDDLLAFAIRCAIDHVPGLPLAAIEDVIAGTARPEQQQGFNIGRRAAMLAGLPETTPGATVSRFCASSLYALRTAFHAIAAGEGDAYIACGVESVSRVTRATGAEDRHPRLAGGPDALTNMYISMGLTAENVARRYGIGRDEQDRFAQRSQEHAVAAQDDGFFAAEISPYVTADGSVVSDDDSPRRGSTLEGLAQLEPAFADNGTVTAGNACPLNDGAAAVVLTSARLADEAGLRPLARIRSSAVAANEPEYMGVGPIPAIRAALSRAGATTDDLSVIEINEAFAAQVIPVCREVGVDPFDPRVNPYGGAIALGHPFGMTGARMVGTMLNGLERQDGELGLVTMCVAGGQGMALVVERAS